MAPVAVSTLAVPAKIVMRGNAKMTLNERFSDLSPKKIQNGHEPVITARLDIGPFAPKAPPFEEELGTLPTSSYNRRMTARRMPDRVGVGRALQPRNRPARQRLSARSRVTFPPRFNRADFEQRFYGDFSSFFNYRPRNRFFRQPRSYNSRPFYKPRFQNRGNFKFGRVKKWRHTGGFYRSFRDGRPFQQRRQRISKDDLDKDIDAYMARTRLHLDADLDAYMADASVISPY